MTTADPDLVARAAAGLSTLLPAVAPPSFGGAWLGSAAAASLAAGRLTLAAYDQVRLALAQTADALGVTARALAEVAEIERAVARLVAADPPTAGGDPVAFATVSRLRADADDLVTRADAQCAARLQALLSAGVPVLPDLRVPGTALETALAVRAGGWAHVPHDLRGSVAALTAAATADDPTAPLLAREIAARIELAGTPALLAADPDGASRSYLQAGGGRLVEVWGDLASARAVVVLVPGTQTSAGHFAVAQAQGDSTYDALRARAGPDVAVVSWLGSPEPPNVAAAALQAYAKKAAPLLRAFVAGLPLVAGARLTLVGHSYGAVVAGEAVRGGLRPAALVGVAPAGFGPGVHDGADLHGVPTYVVEDARDPIEDEFLVQGVLQDLAPPGVDRLTGALGLGHLGDDPRCAPGTTELPSDDDGPGRPPLALRLSVHGEYFVPGDPALQAIVDVAAGGPVPLAPPGTCPR